MDTGSEREMSAVCRLERDAALPELPLLFVGLVVLIDTEVEPIQMGLGSLSTFKSYKMMYA